MRLVKGVMRVMKGVTSDGRGFMRLMKGVTSEGMPFMSLMEPLMSLITGSSRHADDLLESPGVPHLPRRWFARDARVVARALLGCLLVHDRPGGEARVARIVETEAYRGPRDLACHARVGLTARTRVLLGQEGHAYVYFVYGMHDCFNVTCLGEGTGHAVLVRAGEAQAGLEEGARLDGPGRFARAMGITTAMSGQDLTRGPLRLLPRVGRVRVGVSARVGVGYAGEWAERPWRFFDAASPHVSKPAKKAIGRPSR